MGWCLRWGPGACALCLGVHRLWQVPGGTSSLPPSPPPWSLPHHLPAVIVGRQERGNPLRIDAFARSPLRGRIPARSSNKGYRAADWGLDKVSIRCSAGGRAGERARTPGAPAMQPGGAASALGATSRDVGCGDARLQQASRQQRLLGSAAASLTSGRAGAVRSPSSQGGSKSHQSAAM